MGTSSHAYVVIDLFAGIGGLGLGAQAAGGNLNLTVELDPVCCETLRRNKKYHKGLVLEKDVEKISGSELRALAGLSDSDPLIIAGGAPCQPFSKAAYWTDPGDDARYRRARSRGENAERPNPITTPKHDERRSLLGEFLRLVVSTNAIGFVFENVPSILHPRNRQSFLEFQTAFEEAGFFTTSFKLNAAEFGVPQTRERVFLVGLRNATPKAPQPTHSLSASDDLYTKKAVTAGTALNTISSCVQAEPEVEITGKWADALFQVPPGWNYKALTTWAGHPSPLFEAETRFWNFLLKLSPDRPSWTLAASPGPWTGPFHWDNRRLYTSEMAALQSFPKDYVFAGTRRQRVRQIGNAVPPLLAKNVFDALFASLSAGNTQSNLNESIAIYA